MDSNPESLASTLNGTKRSRLRFSWLPFGDETVASSRLRCYAIHEALCRRGIESIIGYDPGAQLLIIQKRIDSFAMQCLYLFKSLSKKVIFDIDDFYKDEDIIRKLKVMIRNADVVTTSTCQQREYILNHRLGTEDSEKISVIPNTIDYSIEAPTKKVHKPKTRLQLVWFGNREHIPLEAIKFLADLPAIDVYLISNFQNSQVYPDKCHFIPWELETFPKTFRSFDICFLSHFGSEADQAKSANKMITSIMLGVPVVASRTPNYQHVAKLAKIEEYLYQDHSTLRTLIERLRDPEARNEYLRKARIPVWQAYNIDAVLPLFLESAHKAVHSESQADNLEILNMLSYRSPAGTPLKKLEAKRFYKIFPFRLHTYTDRDTLSKIKHRCKRVVNSATSSAKDFMRNASLPWRIKLFNIGFRQAIPYGNIKLQLGPNRYSREGYISINLLRRSNFSFSVRKLNFPPESVSSIEVYDVVQHLSSEEADQFLKQAHKILRTGGRLILEWPDILKVSRLVIQTRNSVSLLEEAPFGLHAVFGPLERHGKKSDFHKWGYTPNTMLGLLRKCGFEAVKFSEGMSNGMPIRDTRVEATKVARETTRKFPTSSRKKTGNCSPDPFRAL